MTVPPPDGSRDRRIEDPSNLWIIHPAGRRLLPFALRAGVSANSVSIAGLCLGTAAALAYAQYERPALAVLGLLLSVGWLIADGLDGMVARATRTSSAFGRFLDGLCDHGVFTLLYVALAASMGTAEAWVLAIAAGVAHAVQSSLYEGERARFHRRARGVGLAAPPRPTGGALVRLYDHVAGSLDRIAMPFERTLVAAADPASLGSAYAARAVPPMRLLSLLTANVRVAAIFVATLAADPRLFWWFEIVPLTAVAVIGIAWHRRVEHALAAQGATAGRPASSFIVKEQKQS